MTSYDERRRSSAAVAYTPSQQHTSPVHTFEQGEFVEPAKRGSMPYGPPEPLIAPQPQHPGARRSSSHQPEGALPMAIPRHPGYQSSASYGPAYSNPASYQQPRPGSYPPPPGSAGYGTSPNGGQFYGTSPRTQMQQQAQQSANGYQQQVAYPPRPSYTHNYEDEAVTFDETADRHPTERRQSRAYSRPSTAQDSRRLSVQHAYDNEAYRSRSGSSPQRRDYHSQQDDALSDYDEGYEAGLHDAEQRRRERRASRASAHSSGRHSSHHKRSSREEARTYGDSIDWAWKGVKNLLTSRREP